MTKSPLLPLPDYQRIYQVLYSVLGASEIAVTNRSCIFFAAAGTMILREHYGLPATISVGCMALMVNEKQARVAVYGRDENGVFVNDQDAFHAWIECDGWLIDFMAPIMGEAFLEDGHDFDIPRNMLQKRLEARKTSMGELHKTGDFFISGDAALAESLIDSQPVQFSDLMRVCLAWYKKPPRPLKKLGMGDSQAATKILIARAPSINGVW